MRTRRAPERKAADPAGARRRLKWNEFNSGKFRDKRYSLFALKQLLDGEASSPCNYFAAPTFLKIRAERFNFFKVEPL
jgi:hypothetical protein